MRIRLLVFMILVASVGTIAQDSTPRPPSPTEPVAALLDALRTHDIVAVTDPHGDEQMQRLLLSLIGDSRFPRVAHDIVVEPLSARYQDAIDRFVRGEDVPAATLRKAWEDHTVPNNLGMHAEEVLRTVRAANAQLAPDQRLRVLAGDPPIDWEHITSPQDHRRWIEMRDTYPADMVRRQVLDRGRRALVIYGQGHLQRAQIEANYDTSAWQAQTLVSLLAHDPEVRLFTVWALRDSALPLPEGVASWTAPSLALMRGTTLGATDFGTYSRGAGNGVRFGVRDGRITPVPPREWKSMRMEDQFDALLFLGPPSTMTQAAVPRALCQDSAFMASRLQRLARFAPPAEAEKLKKECGL